jgi:hypothetical protein
MANGNSYLAQQRAPMFAELAQKPWLLNTLASIGESENSGKPLGILEALFNRAAWSGKSLESLVKGGFYGPRTLQRLQSDTSGAGTLSPKAVANAKTALDQIKAGSNVTQGAVDQGMEKEIKSPFKISVDGEYYGDMGNSAAWRQKQQTAAGQAAPATGAQVASNAPTVPAPTPITPSTPSPSSTPAPNASAAATAAEPAALPRAGVGGLGAGSGGRGGITIPGRSLAGVSPVLQQLLGGAKTEFEKANPGYTIQATSGARPGGPSSSQHAGGNAIDMQIVGPNGQAIPNTGNDPSGLYHQYARYVYAEQQANHPELNGKLAWGGAFGTQLGGGGAPDLMHFDLGGERGHWTMNRPSQLGGLPLQLANATTGATTVADQTGGDQKQGPGYGPPVPPGNIVQNGQMYVPAGRAAAPRGKKGGGMGSTAMSQQGGTPYIPILSELSHLFFPQSYPGRPATMTSYNPGATVPVGPRLPAGPNAPAAGNVPTPPTRPPGAPAPAAPAAATTIPGTAGQVPITQGGPPIMPGTVGPSGGGPSAVQQMMGMGGRPLPSTPAQVVASRFPATTGTTGYAQPITPQGVSAPWPTGTTAPTANTPMARIPGILPGASAPLPSSVLNYLNPVSSANAAELPPGPSATAAAQGASAARLPQGASFAERFAGGPGGPGAGQYSNPALAAALGISPQPSFPGGVPMPRANPIAGTQTALTIPPRGPWPPAPPTPQQQPGTTIAGIPLPRPRPQMPGTPPPQIPQPGTIPQPAAVPRPNMPMPGAPGVPPFPPDIARTNATPGPLGGTQMPPDARPGVRFLDTAGAGPGIAATLAGVTGPQTTAQGGPVPPDAPAERPTGREMAIDQLMRSPLTGMVPTSSGDAGAPAVTQAQFMTPAAAARQQFLQDRARALFGPNASIANAAQFQGRGLAPPAGGPYPDPNLMPLPRPGGGFNPAIPRFIGPAGAPSGSVVPSYQGEGEVPPPPNAQGSADAMNQAMIDYLRQQMQQQQNNSPDYGSYAGAY